MERAKLACASFHKKSRGLASASTGFRLLPPLPIKGSRSNPSLSALKTRCRFYGNGFFLDGDRQALLGKGASKKKQAALAAWVFRCVI